MSLLSERISVWRPVVSNAHLICSRQSRPGLVCSPVVILSFGHFHIVTETDQNLSVPQLVNGGPLIQLEGQENERFS